MLFIHTGNIQNIYTIQSNKNKSYTLSIVLENKLRHIKSYIQYQTQSKKDA